MAYRNPLWAPEYTGRKPSFNDMGALRLNPDHPLNIGLQFETLCNDQSCIARDIVHGFDLNQSGGAGTIALAYGASGSEFQINDRLIYREGFPSSRIGTVYSVAFRLYIPTGSDGGKLFGIKGSGDVPIIALDLDYGKINFTITDNEYDGDVAVVTHPVNTYFTYVGVVDGAYVTGYIDGIPGTPTALGGAFTWSAGNTFSVCGRNGLSSIICRVSRCSWWNRALLPSEVVQTSYNPYGTPANPRFIVEPRRTWFVPSAAFKSAWARNSNQLIGGGYVS